MTAHLVTVHRVLLHFEILTPKASNPPSLPIPNYAPHNLEPNRGGRIFNYIARNPQSPIYITPHDFKTEWTFGRTLPIIEDTASGCNARRTKRPGSVIGNTPALVSSET